MKKSISILILLAAAMIAATGAFAQGISLSAGGGVYFDAGIPMWEDAEGSVLNTGAYGFFDFTYAEVDVGFGYYRLTDAEVYGASLNLGLLLKYPFTYERFAIFPLLGARFSIPLTQSYDGSSVDGFKVKDNVHLGLQGGVGMDFPLGKSLYIRASALCNVDFFVPGEDPNDDTLYTIGPMIKVGLGYKF